MEIRPPGQIIHSPIFANPSGDSSFFVSEILHLRQESLRPRLDRSQSFDSQLEAHTDSSGMVANSHQEVIEISDKDEPEVIARLEKDSIWKGDFGLKCTEQMQPLYAEFSRMTGTHI